MVWNTYFSTPYTPANRPVMRVDVVGLARRVVDTCHVKVARIEPLAAVAHDVYWWRVGERDGGATFRKRAVAQDDFNGYIAGKARVCHAGVGAEGDVSTTHARARTHTHAHVHTHAHARSHINVHMHIHIHTRDARMRARTHTHTHIGTCEYHWYEYHRYMRISEISLA